MLYVYTFCVVWDTIICNMYMDLVTVLHDIMYKHVYVYQSYNNIGEYSQVFVCNAVTTTTTTTTTTVAIISTLLVVVIITAGICFTVQIIYKLTTRKKRYCFSYFMHSSILSTTYTYNCRCPVHNIHVYETVRDPKPTKPVEITLKERNTHTCTAMQNEHDYHDGSLTPPLPPRVYSLSSSLDKIDNLENLKLQDLSNQALKDQNSQVRDNENTYQPLIPLRSINNASEYQSLTLFKYYQDTEAKL